MYPFNTELSYLQLTKNSAPVDIKATYFINMDRSVDRKIQFIERFNKTNGPLPLIRVPGVLIEDKTLKKPGDYGCALAHANTLKIISEQLIEGWYLICEDDGFGNFGAIASHNVVKEIVAQTNKKFINLSSQYYYGKLCVKGHSLSKVHGRLTAYLVHSSYSKYLSEIIYKNAKHIAVDILIPKLLQEKRLFSSGNGYGAFVGLIDPPPSEIKSERLAVNHE
jgi:hypothetical protein